ncbi:hydroxysteroid 11-beta-dehydrogenase 1-like protein isoform X1 [Canis lupus familiaris]|uniref:hydroxysteroid 11-beta-dehydrogenase 1-like protein isoform X1 n=1 Tax=Canis lupus familiaris TaxID=9615 RepID=UPI0018F7E027|nr:hydroxysteroid 11-beta-dehydrogenase 1-like protein isoform X1 [Canis lupus familiaris]XP_038284888.1 hydroxysteroid 11-beta-dehydrogenase 1-like protein isoform X1 [Canis lupus familiaris]XP_038284889.1 hydroxysteroid 11-beta-dehydrogenase 1-like protein isoform X1 [Canis lupus familiaris]XP_038284890.1 hydroxysteroid 11-beta-dehydrogenase 1-like protein isoform X1 [Canis lupus familiaris]XP_038284891.1 hydroxysteroid 11-beta-dehydrogenase 1-like protein isoform X1 [Canis lupus familiaris]
MTTLTLPPGSPGAADRGQRRRRGGAGLSLRSPGLPPGAHSPHRGFPAEGGRELPEAGRSRGLLHRCGHGLPRGARARGAVCAGQAGRRELPGAERTGSVLRPQLPEFKVTGPRGGVSSRTSSVLMGLSGPGGLDYLVLNHLGATPAGTRSRSIQGTRWLLQVNLLSYVQLTSLALPSLTDSRGSLVVVSSLLGRVPTSFSSPYSAAKFALDGFFGSLRRELDVQDVNVAITMCVLGLRDRASAAEAVRSSTSPLSPLPLPELPGRRSFVFPEGSPPSSRPRAATPIETPLSRWPRPEPESSRQKRKTEKNLPAPGKSRSSEFASADRVPGTWSPTWKAFPQSSGPLWVTWLLLPFCR